MWNNLSDRIKRILKDQGIKNPALAKVAGVTAAAVGLWVNGRTFEIKGGPAVKIAHKYGYRPEWIMSGDEPIYSGVAESGTRYDSGIETGPSFNGQVPLVSWVTAGDADLAIDLLAPGDADEWLPAPPANHSRSTYVLRVKGDSMTAIYGKSYPDGCLIYVDPEQRGGAGVGDRVIAKINGLDAVTFKQLAEDGGRMFLKPLNPQYPAIFDEFRVLGKVIFKGEPE